MQVNPLAGKPASPESLVNIPKSITAYYMEIPDPTVKEQHIRPGPRIFTRFTHRASVALIIWAASWRKPG